MIGVRLGGVLLAGLAVGGACHSPSTGVSSAVGIVTKGPARTPPGQDGPASADRVVGDRVALGSAGGGVGVTAVERHVDAGRLFPPPLGAEYFAVNVEGCAGPTETAVLCMPEYFGVQLADHTVHNAVPGMKKPDLHGGAIPAGRCLDGWVTFAIPKDQTPVAVVYDGTRRSTSLSLLSANTDLTKQVHELAGRIHLLTVHIEELVGSPLTGSSTVQA